MATIVPVVLERIPKVIAVEDPLASFIMMSTLNIESNSIITSTTSPAIVFKIPRNTMLLTLWYKVTAIWNGTYVRGGTAGGASGNILQLGDGTTAARFGQISAPLLAVGMGGMNIYEKITTPTNFVVTILGSGQTTGALTLIMEYRALSAYRAGGLRKYGNP